jgi:hypothetical protein
MTVQEKASLIKYYLKGNDIFMLCESLYEENHPWRVYKYEPAQGWLYMGKEKEFDKEHEVNEDTIARVIYLVEKSYQEQLEMAHDVAYECHKGQKDKAGEDYFASHIEFVASRCPAGKTKIVAYLHDILEDTDMQPEILLNMGFGQECIDALKLLTHKKGEPYMDYILKLKANPIAKEVKKVDLAHNMDLSRIPVPSEKDIQRVAKYAQAYAELFK